MKATIKVEKEFDFKFLQVKANVRYWEDATINGVEDEKGDLTPCRNGELWSPLINLENGQIENWQQGKKANIHFKVCDDGEYEFLDSDKNLITTIDGYVPGLLSINEDGHGDYIIMEIDERGVIQHWGIEPYQLEQLFNEEL